MSREFIKTYQEYLFIEKEISKTLKYFQIRIHS